MSRSVECRLQQFLGSLRSLRSVEAFHQGAGIQLAQVLRHFPIHVHNGDDIFSLLKLKFLFLVLTLRHPLRRPRSMLRLLLREMGLVTFSHVLTSNWNALRRSEKGRVCEVNKRDSLERIENCWANGIGIENMYPSIVA